MLKLIKKPENLVYKKYSFNRYGKLINLISNFLTEVTDAEEIYKSISSLGKKSMN